MKNCVFIDFSLRNECSMDNVEEVLSSLEHIHREVINNPRAMDTLEEEFFVYQATGEADIPARSAKNQKFWKSWMMTALRLHITGWT